MQQQETPRQFVVAVDYDAENDTFLLIDENGEPFADFIGIPDVLGRVDRLSRRARRRVRTQNRGS